MRLTNMRVVLAAGTVALATAAAAAMLAGASAAYAGQALPAGSAQVVQSQTPRPGDLYFVSGEYIMRVPVAGGKPQRVVKAGQVSVTGMAIAGDRLFWVTQAGEGRWALSYVSLHGAPVAHTLVGNLSFSMGLVAADGWLYWADENAIGRVRPDGAQLNPAVHCTAAGKWRRCRRRAGDRWSALVLQPLPGQRDRPGRHQRPRPGPVVHQAPREGLPAGAGSRQQPRVLGGAGQLRGPGDVAGNRCERHVAQHPLRPGSVLRGRRRQQRLLGLGRRGREPRCTSAPRKWTGPDSTPPSSPARERSLLTSPGANS